jgi:hypothetical protein
VLSEQPRSLAVRDTLYASWSLMSLDPAAEHAASAAAALY